MINRSSRPIATLFGIPLHLHWSAWLTALFIAMSAPAAVGTGGTGAALLVGGLAAVLFGASLVIHEYAHALVARSRGVGVRRVSLWALGGMAELETEPRRWKDELAVSIVGPLASIVVGLLAGGAALGISMFGADVPAALFAWVAIVNLALGVFNMLPGYPLDGGRVLHALVWWRTGQRHRATGAVASIGRVIGGGLIAFGVWSFVNGGGGLLTAFVGWFIMSAAQRARLEAAQAQRLSGRRAGDVARPVPPAVNGDLSVDDFVRFWMPYQPGPADVVLVVDADDRTIGLLPMAAVATAARMVVPGMRIADLAIPATSLGVVTPQTDLGDAYMSSPSGFVLVSEPDRVVGYLTPIDLRDAATVPPRPTPAGSGAM